MLNAHINNIISNVIVQRIINLGKQNGLKIMRFSKSTSSNNKVQQNYSQVEFDDSAKQK